MFNFITKLILFLLFIIFAPITIPLYFLFWANINDWWWSDPMSAPRSLFLDFSKKEKYFNFQKRNENSTNSNSTNQNNLNHSSLNSNSNSSNCNNTNKNPSFISQYTLEDLDKQKHVDSSSLPFLVIGSGFSGLSVCGAMRRQGIDFECVDASSDIGGNWQDGVYETVHIISSRRTTEFKDFPMPDEYPDFPSAPQVRAYLRDYAQFYGLSERLHFRTEVLDIEKMVPGEDHMGEDVLYAAKMRRWNDQRNHSSHSDTQHEKESSPILNKIKMKNIDENKKNSSSLINNTNNENEDDNDEDNNENNNDENENENEDEIDTQNNEMNFDQPLYEDITLLYKGVVVATGHHWFPRLPQYSGMDDFSGEIIHSKAYKGPQQLSGKRTLVIGGGNSACDIAVEAARFAESSDVSHRRGYYFIPRTFGGYPFVEYIRPWQPMWLQRILIRLALLLIVGSNKDYNLQEPDHAPFEHHPTINSELVQFVKLGRIKPRPDVHRFLGGKTVQFRDGSVGEYDLIVTCTGYHSRIPLLDPYMDHDLKTEYPRLVGGIMVPGHRNLYYVGLGQPRYGAGPLLTAGCELLARLIVKQDELEYNVADILKYVLHVPESKQSDTCNDELIDPHLSWKISWISIYLVKILDYVERVGVRFDVLKPRMKY